ncbi:hypothetical protein AMATHDRAFT_64564 [Amanita thiersii Skay4041]|uniref:SET domain-containing protein n=1 Tax=Amanita thiersii Skay4041 TaxID=703135 RepID=A0A2A9NM62_9AGAR|nr:hypothetical protein AMATHDRAFT_64564 [Amanita thiersii Skay4041]
MTGNTQINKEIPLPYTIYATSYGGRGAYAQSFIKAGTRVLCCPAPYASVISRKFRKEVCAWCFKYAFEHGKNTWSCKYERQATCYPLNIPSEEGGKKSGDTRQPKRKGEATTTYLSGVWFCSPECRSRWCTEADFGGLHASLNETLEKIVAAERGSKISDAVQSSMDNNQSKEGNILLCRRLERYWPYASELELSESDSNYRSNVASDTGHASSVPPSYQVLTFRKQLDLVWKHAERVYSPGRQKKRNSAQASKYGQGHHQMEAPFSDFEFDTARFVISALVQRMSEDTAAANATKVDGQSRLGDTPSALSGNGPAVTLADVLELQDNEGEIALWKPEIIASHLRVYGIVKRVVYTALKSAAWKTAGQGCGWNRSRDFIDTSDIVRAILARDHGNVFGIWDTAPQEDSEMLGWGMYVQGSYFNHDCSPNIKKVRVDRALEFYSMRDIEPGEELCTTYIDVNDPVLQRRAELKQEWYFDCACKRCHKELEALGSAPSTAPIDEPVIDSGYISFVDD